MAIVLVALSAKLSTWVRGTLYTGVGMVGGLVSSDVRLVNEAPELRPELLPTLLRRVVTRLSFTNAIMYPPRIDVLPFPNGSQAKPTFGAKLFLSALYVGRP